MDPFVRRLVERSLEPDAGLSRNRHFHTFDNAEGRLALQIVKRLRALAADLEACRREGGVASARPAPVRGKVVVELARVRVRSRRSTTLARAEYELLLTLPGVREALGADEAPREPSDTP